MKTHFRKLQVLAVLVGLSIGGYLGACAHTPTPTEFKDAIVTCTLENSSNAAAGAAVLDCLTGAVAGNYAACLSGLVTAGQWTVQEVACIVRRLATESAQKLNAGTANNADKLILERANQVIRDNNIRFR
jgi:hypothetical protein